VGILLLGRRGRLTLGGGKIGPFIRFYLAFFAFGSLLLGEWVKGVSLGEQLCEEKGLLVCEFDEEGVSLRGSGLELLREGGVLHEDVAHY
jgi:hypothetical protein